MSQQFRAFSHQVDAAAHQVTGSSHLSGIDIDLGKHAAAYQSGDFVRVDLVIRGLATVDRVLEKTSLKKGAMYHHFPSQQALGYAVFID